MSINVNVIKIFFYVQQAFYSQSFSMGMLWIYPSIWLPQFGYFVAEIPIKYCIVKFYDNSRTLIVKISADKDVCFDENYYMFIFNPQWKIMTSISFYPVCPLSVWHAQKWGSSHTWNF